jgi:hypothetical protein
MSPHVYTEEQFVKPLEIAWAELESRGWVSFAFPSFTEQELREQLLSLATSLGTAVTTRTGGGLCDMLLPIEAHEAKTRSLSKLHAVAEFPLHIDTAHWLTPCRFVILACISPGSASRPSLILDTRRIPLDEHESTLLHTTPFRVANGRNSFFSTIMSKSRTFLRLDPGCMTATTPNGDMVLAILTHKNWPNHIESVQWEAGKVVVLDNWRVLHGRGNADGPDFDRKLLRVTIV